MKHLVLTVTRACNLRCSYCPTAKDGWPSLDETDARRAVALFARDFGGGDVKLFGGEPLLVPDVVRAAMEEARERPEVRRIHLSTNGLCLDRGWLDYLAAHPKAVLTISLDGRPEDNRRYRRAGTSTEDAYDHLHSLLPGLLRTPRVVVTQTIAPAAAEHAAANFEHLVELGFWRFNFLPAYYVRWQKEQLVALRTALADIAARIASRWASGERTYVRNLFTWAPTPFFNTGLVVDADRTIHASNLGLSSALQELADHTRVGTLDEPPTPDALQDKAAEVNALLAHALPADVTASTRAVDGVLTEFCRGLYAPFAEHRRRRRVA